MGDWIKRSETRPEEIATREEIMMALASVDNILIKLQYTEGYIETVLNNIEMDSAAMRNFGLGSAVYVEECSCPTGYTGLSCEVSFKKFQFLFFKFSFLLYRVVLLAIQDTDLALGLVNVTKIPKFVHLVHLETHLEESAVRHAHVLLQTQAISKSHLADKKYCRKKGNFKIFN